MTNFDTKGFDIPNGFTKEEIEGQLCHEDLDEDSELWLIRVPSDIELSVLDKKKVCIDDNSSRASLKEIKTESGKILQCCAENCEIPNICAVLPEKNGKKLHAVHKTFKGAILISEGLSLDDDTEVKCEIDNDQHVNTFDDSLNSTHEFERKKRKKKKTHSRHDDNDLNYETEDADNVISSVNRHKHPRKRSEVNKRESDENVEIKSEPE